MRRKDGSAAIEFAIVGPVYLALALSSLEAGLILTKSVILDNAMVDAAKYVYIGAANDGSITQDDLHSFVCERVEAIVSNCSADLAIEVIELSTLDEEVAYSAPCRDSTTEMQPVIHYSPGSGGDVMYIRACLTTSVSVPGLGLGLALTKTDSGRFEIISSTAFLNEPF